MIPLLACRPAWRYTLVAAMSLVSACGADTLDPEPLLPQAELFWRLDLNHHAATLSAVAPWDTLRLTATPRNHSGDALANVSDVVFTSRDPGRVVVSPDGLVRVVDVIPAGTFVVVAARARQGRLSLADSVRIYATAADDPPELGSFDVGPLPPDSAKWTVTTNQMLAPSVPSTVPVRIADAGGVSLDLPVYFRSSDTAMAPIDPVTGGFYGRRIGSVDFVATVTAYGKSLTDTVRYRIGWPVLGKTEMFSDDLSAAKPYAIGSPDVTIGAGGAVLWYVPQYDGREALTITISGPAAPVAVNTSTLPIASMSFTYWALACQVGDCDAGGDVVLRRSMVDGFDYGYGAAGRIFPVPGVYTYTSSVTDGVGRITVVDERLP